LRPLKEEDYKRTERRKGTTCAGRRVGRSLGARAGLTGRTSGEPGEASGEGTLSIAMDKKTLLDKSLSHSHRRNRRENVDKTIYAMSVSESSLSASSRIQNCVNLVNKPSFIHGNRPMR
jgi:hypothetical protein